MLIWTAALSCFLHFLVIISEHAHSSGFIEILSMLTLQALSSDISSFIPQPPPMHSHVCTCVCAYARAHAHTHSMVSVLKCFNWTWLPILHELICGLGQVAVCGVVPLLPKLYMDVHVAGKVAWSRQISEAKYSWYVDKRPARKTMQRKAMRIHLWVNICSLQLNCVLKHKHSPHIIHPLLPKKAPLNHWLSRVNCSHSQLFKGAFLGSSTVQ